MYFVYREEFEVTIPENIRMVGRILVFKFLKPRCDQSETIGVVGVNVFGYTKTSEYFLEVSASFYLI